MVGKRTSTTRPQAESSRRGRPRRTVRSAYATAGQEGPDDVQPEADQTPPVAEPAKPTTAKELQLLQTQLQNFQQKRDRIAAAYAANQEAALAAASASEIRLQLSILQAEIQSMQPPLQPMVHPIVLPNVSPMVNVQPVNYSGTGPSFGFFRGLQASPRPTTYKPITLPKFNGKTDPHQFLMSFEVAVASAGRNETVMAKSFVIAAEGDVLAWYSMLKPRTIYSWENLRDKISANFHGFIVESLTSTDLFQCRQSQGEALWDYFQRFMQTKAKAPSVPEKVAIKEAIKGLHIGPFAAHLAREKPPSMHELYHEFKKYCKSDNDFHKRLEEQNLQRKQANDRNSKKNNPG